MSTTAHTSARHYVTRINDPGRIDVKGIQQTIAAGLRPVVSGCRIDPAEVARVTANLVGDAEVLLPVAEARYKDHGGQVTMGLDSLRRRLAYHRPDPRLYPLNAALCAADLARSCRTLLKLVTEPVDPHRVVLTTW
jgi:hypothetical protein